MQTVTAGVRPVPEQISKLAHDCPHSIALSYGDRQLSYEALNRKADQFAATLAMLGVVSGGTVAVCMERSFDWIVAALGILRAGATYVPLDSTWPDARLIYSVNDSGATVLVARSTLLDRLQVAARGIDPRRDAAAIAAAPVVSHRPIEPESLAYLIYTSGSTGVPKGVEITHANLAHLVRWHSDAFSVTRQDRASHLAGLGFDAAVWEIWPHLCAGATVCLADDGVCSSPELMQRWMLRERVTIGFVPTVQAASMMAMEWPATTALRLLLTGGDTLYRAPSVPLPFEVVNNYGPTECTVIATSSMLKPGSQGQPPIGRPITDTNIYLLNEDGDQVPDGSTGEIYIGGAGVGRGYRNLPDFTERSFLADPFAGKLGARMYRTGDRGVRRPDGEIEFRGRLDRQTKIRGQRVELDEIGINLTHHPRIDFATVVANFSEGEENQFIAYVLPKEHACLPTTHELQEHLLRSLPQYMIPAIFVRLHVLPISANGKLDLAMLPQPTEANLLEGMTAKPQTSPIGEKLLTMVRELLQNDAIVAGDNFFLAGGHSLLGMQLLMRLGKAFGVDLTLQQLFEAPTVEALAFLVERRLNEDRLAEIWADLLGQKQLGLDDNFFDLGGHSDLVASLQQRIATELGQRISIAELLHRPTIRQQAEFTQGHAKSESMLPPGVLALQPHGTRNSIFWVNDLLPNLAKAVGDDQPFLSVVLTAEDIASLGQTPTLQDIAARLVRKILATQPKGTYTIGGLCLNGVLAFEIASQLRTAGSEVSLLVLLDPPDPSFLESHDSFSPKFTHPRYAFKRAARLGSRTALVKFRERLLNHFPHSLKARFARTKINAVQEMIKAAAFAYRLRKYEGKVLLVLASDRPPHVNLLPGWQAVVSRDLYAEYVDAHHSELTNAQIMPSIVCAIASHLTSTTDAGTSPPTCDGTNSELDKELGFNKGWWRRRKAKLNGAIQARNPEERLTE